VSYSGYFIAGVAMFLIHRFGSNFLLWAIVGFSWVMALHNDAGNSWVSDVGLPAWPVKLLITLSFALVAVFALGRLRWLSWRGLTVLGVLTYPLYLLHYTVGTGLSHILVRQTRLLPWFIVPLVVALLCGGAWLVHRYVERPWAPPLKRALNRSRPSRRPRIPRMRQPQEPQPTGSQARLEVR
jgi:peptidoglycan/LPS O-acetylase OafA/YrhL